MRRSVYTLLLIFVICFSGYLFFTRHKTSTQEINLVTRQYTAPWDKTWYEIGYARANTFESDEQIIGGIIPHHLLASYIDASFFRSLEKQSPPLVVLLSPNHMSRGHAGIIATEQDWETPYGVVKTDHSLIEQLVAARVVTVDEKAIAEEHGIYGLVPFVHESLPQTKIASFIFSNNVSIAHLDAFISELEGIAPKDTVFISSIDFSHYQTKTAADFHDDLSLATIESFDYSRLNKLEIDSVPSLYAILKIMEHRGAQKIARVLHDNSAVIGNTPGERETTSYVSPYFITGLPTRRSVASFLYLGTTKPGDLASLAGREGRFLHGTDAILSFDETKESIIGDYDFSLVTIDSLHQPSNVVLGNMNVDYVLARILWHGESKERREALTRRLVDAGVDIVFSDSTKYEASLEIYKNRPIFYSSEQMGLGAFFSEKKELKLYFFPLENSKSGIRQMDYKKSLSVFKNFVDKSLIGTYNFNNFSLSISL